MSDICISKPVPPCHGDYPPYDYSKTLSESLRLRKTRPPTRVFGPEGPEVPPEGVSEGVLQGSFEPRPKMCPKSDFKVSKKTLFGHI